MSMQFNQAYEDLLSTWKRHQELRDRKAGLGELAESRMRLHTARAAMAQARRGV